MNCALDALPYTAFAHQQDIDMSASIAKMPEARWLSYQLRKIDFEKAARSRVLHRGLLVSEKSFPETHKLVGEICAKVGVPHFEVAVGDYPLPYITGLHTPIVALPSDMQDKQALTQMAMHIKCAHLPILLLAEFAAEYVQRLDVGSSVLVRLNTAIRKWRVFALMSTDRGAALLSENSDSMLEQLGATIPGANPADIIEQGRALCSDNLGILCDALGSPGISDACISQRVYDLSEWFKSETYKKISAGEYINSEKAPSAIWGGFAGEGSTGWESESLEDFPKSAGMYSEMSDTVKNLAGEFGGVAQQGISVISQTATSFIEALSKELKKGKQDER